MFYVVGGEIEIRSGVVAFEIERRICVEQQDNDDVGLLAGLSSNGNTYGKVASSKLFYLVSFLPS